jgi:predicted glycoside hydrolase/deacetylase ChbG (UPF0249 family)
MGNIGMHLVATSRLPNEFKNSLLDEQVEVIVEFCWQRTSLDQHTKFDVVVDARASKIGACN